MSIASGISFGIPFRRNFESFWESVLINNYYTYREYVLSEGGIIVDEVATAMIFCEGLSEARVRAILYKDYVESQGGTILNLSKLKETFENIT